MKHSVTLARAIEAGLARGEFFVLYQPVVNSWTSDLESFEALVRWDHPVLGVVGPNVFIPSLEESGDLGALTELVLREATRTAAHWPAINGRYPSVRVNLPAGLLADAQLPALVADALAQAQLPGHRLIIEVTERGRVTTASLAAEVCHQLRRCGVTIALDDFAAVPSDLWRLAHLPVDEVKLDLLLRSPGEGGLTQVRDLLQLSTAAGRTVTVEGVESMAQLSALLGVGAPRLQGHLFGPPSEADSRARVRALARRARRLVRTARRQQPAPTPSARQRSGRAALLAPA